MKIEMLLDFGDQQDPSVQLDRHCVIDCWQASAGELDVDDRPADPSDYSILVVRLSFRIVRKLIHAPEPECTGSANNIYEGRATRGHNLTTRTREPVGHFASRSAPGRWRRSTCS